MPGTLVPDQMFDHECNVLKGWWHLHALDKTAPLADGEEIAAGRVCYLNASGEFALGLPDNCMPIFAWPNSTDFDVSADVGNTQSENMMGLPATGSYELQTTEFDDSYTYAINDHLTAWNSSLAGYTAAKNGKVRTGTPYTHTICGVCSGVKVQNEHGKYWISLWTYYLPVNLESGS